MKDFGKIEKTWRFGSMRKVEMRSEGMMMKMMLDLDHQNRRGDRGGKEEKKSKRREKKGRKEKEKKMKKGIR